MRALPLLCLALCASAAGVHAQDRYSMRGVTVVRDTPRGPSSAPAPAPLPAAYAPGAPAEGERTSGPVSHVAAAPMRYLSWPGKRDAQLSASSERADLSTPATIVQPARFVAPPRAGAMQSVPATPSRYAPAPAAAAPQGQASARAPSIYDAPPAQPRVRTTAAVQPPRPESTHSLFRSFTDAAPAPERTATAASYRPARKPATTPARTAPERASQPARDVQVAAQAAPVAAPVRSAPPPAPTVPQQASLTPRRAPLRWDQRPEFAAPPAQTPAQAPAPVPTSAPAAKPLATAKAAKTPAKNVAIPVAMATTAGPAALPAASVPVATAGRTPYQAANGGTQARFYSVHREFGVRPDPITMPKQFFLDGSPDLARPPPLPIPRITPTSGQSTAVQRAAAERSQEDPDAPAN